MFRFLVLRVIGAVGTVVLISSMLFLFLRVSTDPAAALVTGESTAQQVQAVRTRLGLDRPIVVQYASFISGMLMGKMSPSYRNGRPSMELVLERAPATFALASWAMGFAVVVALPLGMVAAMRRNSIADYLASVVGFLGFAVPTFWLGSMLIIVFGVTFKLLPTSGSGSLRHVVLPALTLGMWPLGQLVRLIRSELLEVLDEDYVRTAVAKGVGRIRVVWRHAFRNAAIPVLTLTGLLVGSLLSGAVVTETIFGWPGIGRLALEAAVNRDLPVIEATVVFIATVFVGMNLLVDLLYAWVDPRLRA